MSKEVASSGISFTTLLFLVFLVLKLTNTITWSWWFVTMPLWVGPLFVLVIAAILIVFGILCAIIGEFLKH